MAEIIQAATVSCTAGASSSEGRLRPQNSTRELHALSCHRCTSGPMGVSIFRASPPPGDSVTVWPLKMSCGTMAKKMAMPAPPPDLFRPVVCVGGVSELINPTAAHMSDEVMRFTYSQKITAPDAAPNPQHSAARGTLAIAR